MVATHLTSRIDNVNEPSNRGKKWTEGDDSRLLHYSNQGYSHCDIARWLFRTEFAIKCRLEQLVKDTTESDDIVLTIMNDQPVYNRIKHAFDRLYSDSKSSTGYVTYRKARRAVFNAACKLALEAPARAQTAYIMRELWIQMWENVCDPSVDDPLQPSFAILELCDSRNFPREPPEIPTAELEKQPHWGSQQYGRLYRKKQAIQLTNPKEQDMSITNAPAVEVKTFIFGQDAKNVTSESIYTSILSLEAQIDALNKISSKPDSLIAKIKALQADIKALVAFENARTPEVAKATITIIE